jgi:sugar lactone lactonase YvrE
VALPRASSGGRVTSVRPLWAIEGGRITLEGEGFPVDPGIPQVRVGAERARLATVSSSSLTVLIPEGMEGGSTAVRIDELPGESTFVEIGAPLVAGVHHVDSPAYDRHGNLYVTFSGSRGQQAPVAIFIVRPDGTREPFVTDLPNPTSLAFGADGRLYVSSRFDGSVYRVEADGRPSLYASDLGVACGLAFAADGALYVGDRSGSVLRVEADGRARVFATLPPSVAAFHLAFGPDGHLYVTAPTLGTHDPVYRISPDGSAAPWSAGFGRPQGLAFDSGGNLFVVDALAGSSGVYRIRPDAPHAPELMLSGGSLIGLAFDPHGGIALAASEVVYRLAVGTRGLLPQMDSVKATDKHG